MREIRETARRNAEREAKKIVALAIQRIAAEHTAESTVSAVSLPNDEMKGRIIGREGRNIRAFELATGVDVIIDDTPDTVVVSCFDPIRREIARLALEKLVSDGRIHPGRIEEVVNKSRKEVDAQILEIGEQAAYETGIHGLHPELVKRGLLEWVNGKPPTGHLFASVFTHGRDGYGQSASKWYNRTFRKQHGINRDFHSFRHTVMAALDAAGVHERIINAIVGHAAGKSMSLTVYEHGLPLAVLHEAISRIPPNPGRK